MTPALDEARRLLRLALQHRVQGQVHIEIATPDFLLLQEPAPGQSLKILGGGDT